MWANLFLRCGSTVSDAMMELLEKGAEDVSLIEGEETFFCAKIEEAKLQETFVHIDRVEKIQEEIDWEEQWQLFCPYYKEGYCAIPLADFSSKKGELLLLPGAGFGDLSHPTTTLILRQMEGKVEGRNIADIGCGSGILGLFALSLGARKVWAVDIDEKALAHTRANAALNHLEDRVTIGTSLEQNSSVDVCLVNMTWQEQKELFRHLPIQKHAKVWITSGILREQLADYLIFMESRGLVPKEIIEEKLWVCIVFTPRQPETSQ